jgi:Domain of unknown function (DUF4345)
MTMFAKYILILVGLVFMAFGIAFLAKPVDLAPMLGITAPSSHALVEIRAFYGGLELTLGLILLLAAGSERHHRLGLALAVALCASLGLVRAVAMLTSGTSNTGLLVTLAIELGLAILGVIAWHLAPKTPVG